MQGQATRRKLLVMKAASININRAGTTVAAGSPVSARMRFASTAVGCVPVIGDEPPDAGPADELLVEADVALGAWPGTTACEIVAFAQGRKLTFFDLQKRLGRKSDGADLFATASADVPVA